ncbi:MAG: HNH endonuclease [Planctomycetes bacterium]|nr:HNH endonuclease [Planctomycetota bacterium]
MSPSALDSSVLVLNKHFTAVHVVNARRAFCLLYKRIAEVISLQGEQFRAFDLGSWTSLPPGENGSGEEERVRTVACEIRVPRIIRLVAYDKFPRHQIRFNRRNIFARDGNRCQYCGRRFPSSELSLDHVVPRSGGGDSTWENLVSACRECNARKGGRTPPAAGMKLIRKPVKPHRNPAFALPLHSAKYRSWKQFVTNPFQD